MRISHMEQPPPIAAKIKSRTQVEPGLCPCYFLPQETATAIHYQRGFPDWSRKLYVSFPMATDLAISAVLPSNVILEPTTVTLSPLRILISYCFMNVAGARWTSMLPVSFFTVICEPTVPVTG